MILASCLVRKYTRKMVIAAGVMPVIRLACPSVSGFDLSKFQSLPVKAPESQIIANPPEEQSCRVD